MGQAGGVGKLFGASWQKGRMEGRVNYGREVGAARLTGSKTTLDRGGQEGADCLLNLPLGNF